jgi:WD40 repeat protein
VEFGDLHYSPDGTLLASSGSGLVRVWEAQTGKLVSEAKVPNAWQINSSAAWQHVFSADGKTVVLHDGKACRWFDVRTGREVQSCAVAMPHDISHRCLSPRGEMIAVTGCGDRDNDLIVYDLPSGTERFRCTGSAGPQCTLEFSPDGKTLAVNGNDAGNTLCLFDTATGKQVAQIRSRDDIYYLAFSADGKKLLVTDCKNEFRLWSVPDGKMLQRPASSEKRLYGTTFAPDGASFLGGDYFDVVQIDLATGKELRRFPTQSISSRFAFTPDGRGLAIGHGDSISQWDFATGRPHAASADLAAYSRWRCLHFESGGRLLWSWFGAFVAKDWRTGREVRRIPAPREWLPWPSVLSPDGSRLACVDSAKKHVVRDVGTNRNLLTLPDSTHRVSSQAFTPDGKVLFTNEWNGPVRSWNVDTGTEQPIFDATPHFAPTLVVSPDGRWLAVADCPVVKMVAKSPGEKEARPEIMIRDLQNGTGPRRLLPRTDTQWVWDVAFSPDGTRLAAVGCNPLASVQEKHGFIALWDVLRGVELFNHAGFPNRSLVVVAFSPDGRQVAAGGDDGVLTLWEVATGQERHRFAGHIGSVHDVAFAPDGKFLAAASADAPVLVWDVEGCYGKPPSAVPFTAAEAENLWQTLNDSNATAAFDAMRQLLTRPGPAVALLRERLKPARTLDEEGVRRLLRDLDADEFATRERASAELELLADRAGAALRKALEGKPSEEVKRRIGQLLESTGPGAPGLRRQLRAVEVAERLGTAEARRLLGARAGGDQSALLTQEARAAVQRLQAR